MTAVTMRAGELHQAGADEVPDAFGVGHDARDQHAGLRRVEVADRQAHDVRLDVLAHVGDRALRRDAEHLRDARTSVTAWTSVAAPAASASGGSRSQCALRDDVVDQVLRAWPAATRPASRLTSIRPSPSASRLRCVQDGRALPPTRRR